MIRSILCIVLAVVATNLRAEDASGLNGRVENRTYISATGVFKVTIPVLPQLGGAITDTPNVVTFEDDFNTYISIAAIPQDATQRWELATRGMKDYLAYFFANYILPDFTRNFAGAKNESAKFIPGQLDGTLLTSTLLPGGSMLADKIQRYDETRIPVAKRGNLVFVKSGHVFVISVELAERVIEGKAYTKTTAEEDDILRQRLTDIVGRMQFATLPGTDGAGDAKK